MTSVINNTHASTTSNNVNQQQELFWKVFKNKYINSIIFSFIKSPQLLFENVFKYDQINNVEWMLKNSHYQLLRSKVLSSDYLTFNCIIKRKRSLKRKQYDSTSNLSNFDNIFYEYSIFNNPFKFDVEFHSKLLSNYSEYFNPTTAGTLMDYLQMYAIEYDNVALLQVLIEEYELIISDVVSLFSQCVDIGSVEIAYYLYKTTSEIKENEINSNWNKVIDTSDGWEILNKKVELFINRLKFKSTIPIDSNLFDFVILKMSLKSIIECCQTIIYLEPHLNQFINSFKNNTIDKFVSIDKEIDSDAKLEKYKILTNDELNQIKSNYNNSNSNEMNKLICQFSSSDQNIKSLFNMLIMFTENSNTTPTGYNVISDNFKFYKAKYYSTYYKHTSNDFLGKIEYYPRHFADYIEGSPISFSQNNDFFIFCNDDREKIKLFIKKYCCQGNLEKIKRDEVIEYFIKWDDIEMLEIIFKEFENQNELFTFDKFPFKSTKAFDFILKKSSLKDYGPTNTVQDQLINIINKTKNRGFRLEFSRYFKLNYPNEVNSCKDNIPTTVRVLEKDYAMYFFENWKDYENLPLERLKELSREIWTELPIDLKLSEFKNLIENYYKLLLPKINHLFTENDLKYPIYRVSIQKPFNHQQISYLLDCGNETIVNDLILGKFRYAESRDIITVAYLKSIDKDNCGSSDLFISSSILKNHIELYSIENTIQSLTEVIISNSDLKLLDYLFDQLKLKHEIGSTIFNNLIDYILFFLNNQTNPTRPEMKLKGLVCNGSIKILNYLLSNNFKFENLGPFKDLFNVSILEGNIQFIKQLINKFGLETFISSVNAPIEITSNNFFIPFYFNKYHSSK